MIKITKSRSVPMSLQGANAPISVADIKESVYRADDVRTQLCDDQHHKCAYCESIVSKAYNDVEHFRPKSKYYWLAYNWDNLLYACDLCNRTFKNDDFPLASEGVTDWVNQNVEGEVPLIINPAQENPLNHIWYEGAMMKPLLMDGIEDAKGVETITRFRLNNRDERPELVQARESQYEIYEAALSVLVEMDKVLQMQGLPQVVYESARKAMMSNLSIIHELRHPSSPYSGMIEYFERRRLNN